MQSEGRAAIFTRFKDNFVFRFYKLYLFESISIVKDYGFKELVRQKGWKIFFAVILYYLIRDTLLYVLIPFLIARGIID